jgi:hypothetical protein
MRLELNLTASPELMECLRMLISTTMTADSSQMLQCSFTWPQLPDEFEPIERLPVANSRSEKTFLSLFLSEILPSLEIEDKASTISGYRTAVKHFCDWFDGLKTPREMEPNSTCAKNNRRSRGPTVMDLEKHPTLLAKFYVFSLKNGGVKTASNKIKSLRTIWRRMFAAGHIKKPLPEMRSRLIRKQQKIETVKQVPMPASNEEIDRLLTAAIEIRDTLTWPNVDDLEPFQFWWNVIAICTVHGFRPGDIWPRESRSGLGLLWSEVFRSPSPPLAGGNQLQANWEFGWIKKRTNKTGETLIAPMSPHLRWLVDQCDGLDKARVFPLPYNGKFWDREFGRIRTQANLPHVSLCDGAPSHSLRKTAATKWKRAVNRAASSHMMCHAIDASEDQASDITERHYSGADILREIVAGFPTLLADLPASIRC